MVDLQVRRAQLVWFTAAHLLYGTPTLMVLSAGNSDVFEEGGLPNKELCVPSPRK